METSEVVSFPISSNSSLFIKSLSTFTDSDGTEYLTFQSNESPEIYVYNLKNQQLIKTIQYHEEGSDAIGAKAAGFMINGWNRIYIPNLYIPEISVIDSSGRKLNKIDLTKWTKDYAPIPTRSVIGNSIIINDSKLYCMQLPNPFLKEKKDVANPTDI